MPILYKNKPKRLLAFGCSSTNYVWPTWPEILAHSLGCELYNFATPSNSNNIIFNTLMQADAHLNFDKNDLVMVCWASGMRDAKNLAGAWQRFDLLKESYFKDKVDLEGYLIELMGLIKGATDTLLLKECQFHQFSASGIYIDEIDTNVVDTTHSKKIRDIYGYYINQLLPSMCYTLYNTYSSVSKMKQMQDFLKIEKFMDFHFTPDEHLSYIEKTFDVQIQSDTKKLVYDYLPGLYDIMRTVNYDVNDPWKVYYKKILEYKEQHYLVPNQVNNMPHWSKFYVW